MPSAQILADDQVQGGACSTSSLICWPLLASFTSTCALSEASCERDSNVWAEAVLL
jgi:hypothetical protein